nr:hypothetical protein [Candidatus Delongbacteria bacterium]
IFADYFAYDDGSSEAGYGLSGSGNSAALRFKLKDRGFIRQGYYADLVLVNPRQAYTVNNKNTLYKCGWSPFEDQTFSHSISKTMVNGEIVFDGTQIVEKQVAMPLYFDR